MGEHSGRNQRPDRLPLVEHAVPARHAEANPQIGLCAFVSHPTDDSTAFSVALGRITAVILAGSGW